MSKILVINAGSSTIKWKVFANDSLKLLAEGIADRIGIDGLITTSYQDHKDTKKISLSNHYQALMVVIDNLKAHNIITSQKEICSIGHRIAHGGSYFTKSVIINKENLHQIEKLSLLAPLHNPNAVKVIKACQELWGNIVQSATFDTAFHTTINAINHTYPIDQKLAKELKIKKYGFHGTSYEYITKKLEVILQKTPISFVAAHLGNGASLCAIKNSKSLDTSMGLTPLAGIMMGTRSGDIDPWIPSFIMDSKQLNTNQVSDILNKKSGLLGVSQLSPDVRDLKEAVAKNNKQAQFALDLYAQKIVDYIAIYANKLENQLDAIVFSAGVGENDPELRASVIAKLKFNHIEIYKHLNNQRGKEWWKISSSHSQVPVYVIKTNEELMIAQDNKHLRK